MMQRFFNDAWKMAFTAVVLAVGSQSLVADESGENETTTEPAVNFVNANPQTELPSLKAKSGDNAMLQERIKAQVKTLRRMKHDLPNKLDHLRAIRELTLIGEPAVEPLVEELKKAEFESEMRLLAVTLRILGDKRAIPALIEALPRTFNGSSRETSELVNDPELAEFLRQIAPHRPNPYRSEPEFQVERSIHEIGQAIVSLTGVDLGEMELVHISSRGTNEETKRKRDKFTQVVERRGDWWAKLEKGVHEANPLNANVAAQLPTGKDICVGRSDIPIMFSSIFKEPIYVTTYDLDKSASVSAPANLVTADSTPDVERWKSANDLKKWATEQGVDLVGLDMKFGKRIETYHVLAAHDMQIWEITNIDVAKNLRAYQKGRSIYLGRPVADGLLVHWDEFKQVHDPTAKAEFLFITSSGLVGILNTYQRNPMYKFAPEMEEKFKKEGKQIDTVAFNKLNVSYQIIYRNEEARIRREGISPGRDPRLIDLIEKLKANEKLYENLEVKVSETYEQTNVPITEHPKERLMGEIIVRRKSKIHSVMQTGKFRVDQQQDSTGQFNSMNANKSSRIFDLNKTTVSNWGASERKSRYEIYEGRSEDVNVVRPHLSAFRDNFITCPLSVQLQGDKAIRDYPNLAWALSSGIEKEVSHRGTEMVNGATCHVVWITGIATYNKAPSHRYIIWLDETKNYIPVKSTAYTFLESSTVPVAESEVQEWKELKQGVWFPIKTVKSRFEVRDYMNSDDRKVSWRQTDIVDSLSLEPRYDKSFFNMPIPDGSEVADIDKYRIINRYVQGESVDQKKAREKGKSPDRTTAP